VSTFGYVTLNVCKFNSICVVVRHATSFYCRVVCDRCVECLIEEQKKKWLNRLDEIRAIDTATQATVYRLSLIRANEQSPRVSTLLLLYLMLLVT
jgi:hypothetical protein